MGPPLFLRYVIDDVLLEGASSDPGRFRALHIAGAAFLGLIVVSQSLSVLKDYNTRRLNQRIVLSLRRALFGRMIRLPLAELNNMKTGGVISRLTEDVSLTTGLLQLGFVSPGMSLVRLTLAVGMLFFLNWRLAILSLAVIPVAIFVSFSVARKIRPIYRSMRKDGTAIDARVAETFGGIRVVRSFRGEVIEELQHAIGRHTVVRKNLFAARREIALWSVWGFLMASVNLAALWFGGWLVLHGNATIGDIMAFQWYAMLLVNPVWQIVNSFSELQRSLASMERVFEVLGMPEDKPDRPDAVAAPRIVDKVSFENVTFEYNPGRPVLIDFDVSVPGGSTVRPGRPQRCWQDDCR